MQGNQQGGGPNQNQGRDQDKKRETELGQTSPGQKQGSQQGVGEQGGRQGGQEQNQGFNQGKGSDPLGRQRKDESKTQSGDLEDAEQDSQRGDNTGKSR